MGLRKLDFDSDIFGCDVGQADPARLDPQRIHDNQADWAKQGYRLVYMNIPVERSEWISALLRNGWTPIAGRVLYRGPVPSMNGEVPRSGVGYDRVDGELVSPDWVDLACQSGEYSHYRKDSRIPEDHFREIYRRWVENSLAGRVADATFAARSSGRLVGLVTTAVRGREGNIGLLAVSSTHRRMGIGVGLMAQAFDWMRGEGLVLWNVVTQTENLTACRFYEKWGARSVTREMTYHLWL